MCDIMKGTSVGVMKGDTRSVDSGCHIKSYLKGNR